MNLDEYPCLPQSSPPRDYPGDRTWGIAILILSLLAMQYGWKLIGIEKLFTTDDRGVSAGFNPGPGAVVLGLFLMVSSAGQFLGGTGVLTSRRWGFVSTAAFSTVSLLLSLGNLPQGFIPIAINAAILSYGYVRLSGKKGLRPI